MSLKTQSKAWLRLFRGHTAILEAPLAVLGAALGIGAFFDPRLLLWLVFGVAYHFVGYGMNSYVDWKKGFDKDDPRKQHHPLNTGDIDPESAKSAIISLMGLLMLYGLALGGFSTIAVVSVSVMVISGVAYNYFGKVTDLKFIPISVVHTMVFVYPYLLYSDGISIHTDSVDQIFFFMTLAYFTHHIFQIMISGDVKDIDQDEASLIKRLGATATYGVVYDDKFVAGEYVELISYSLVAVEVTFSGIAVAIALSSVESIALGYILMPLFSVWMVHEASKVIETGPLNREQRVLHMSRKELAGYMMIHSAALPVIGLKAFVLLTVFIFGYLFATSRFIWGNWVKPEV